MGWRGAGLIVTLALCWQVESLKEKLISQAQEVSRLRSELVRPPTHPAPRGRRPVWEMLPDTYHLHRPSGVT